MFSRFSRIARPLSRPAALSTTQATVSLTGAQWGAGIMASTTAQYNFARTIQTAACLIIGDEVLGGKACSLPPCKPPSNVVQDVADLPLYRPKT